MGTRRGNREGTFRWEKPTARRKYGRWTGRVLVAGVGRLTVVGRKDESKTSVRDRLHNKRDGYAGVTRPSKGSLAEWFDLWLRLYCKDLAPRTRASYADEVRLHLSPLLGERPLARLEPDEVIVALDKIPKAPSRRYAYSVLRIALGRAVKTGRAPHNVCLMIDRPKVTYRTVEPPTAGQVVALLTRLHGHRDEALIVTALAAGIRQGELVGLRWMDLDAPTLHVRGQLDRSRQYVGAKRGSERVVALPPVALEALEAHRQRVTFALGRQPEPTAYIFADAHGRPMTGYEAYRRWQVALKAAGIAAMPMHSTRHWYASVHGGEERDIVAKLMGHKETKMTAHYTHLSPDDRERAASRVNDALGG